MVLRDKIQEFNSSFLEVKMNQLFGFLLIFVIMGVGLDIMFRGNPTIHGAYRRTVGQATLPVLFVGLGAITDNSS